MEAYKLAWIQHQEGGSVDRRQSCGRQLNAFQRGKRSKLLAICLTYQFQPYDFSWPERVYCRVEKEDVLLVSQLLAGHIQIFIIQAPIIADQRAHQSHHFILPIINYPK